MIKRSILRALPFFLLALAPAPASAVVATFQVEGAAYTSVTVNTQSSTLRYNYPDGTGFTVAVPSNQIWEYFWYYAKQDRSLVNND
jgi:uncharacterized protein YigE (DUF2233 family)